MTAAGGGGGVTFHYEFHKELSKCGTCVGVVYLCKDKVTHKYVECKFINRMSSAYNPDSIKRGIQIMIELTECCGFERFYVDDEHVDLIMEYCPGSDLYNRLMEITWFMESNAKIIFKQLMGVVESCHDIGVVHRDIKLENIFLVTEENDQCPDIRLGDFGLATYIKPGEKLHKACGSLYCIAPEMLDRNPVYNQAVDVWSAGVVLFIFLVEVRRLMERPIHI
ncbi:calcium-dependent protein kinase 29-like [Papaver somniferum]|uniref:calcium-dependent protein kinase 29-like n=1 Tax=Papaver somniferum TaxID=3469 RepID=UPI000E701188|nr:calcium-dependent protein kinase 29-like [Papaver somniferum]